MVKVSVLMSTKDPQPAQYQRAVQSLIAQTETDWELILIDDASQPQAAKLIAKVAAMDPRIHLYVNTNSHGLAAALNRALRHAQGAYLARMDDDDQSLPERFAVQLQFLDRHPELAFVGSNVTKFGVTEDDGMIKLPQRPQAKDFLWNSPYIHPSVMFRQEALRQVGGYRTVKAARRAEDYDLFMRMYQQGLNGANIQTPLLRYFIDVASMKKKRLYRYRIDEFNIRRTYFKKLRLPWYRVLFEIKPLVVGLIPHNLIYAAHARIKR
ncbi:glycosyltransferase [Lacticaseibacillus sp. GG6-2]